MKQPKLKNVFSQPAWVIKSDKVELSITQLGGHIAPVKFCNDTKTPIQPYYISPWQKEKYKIDEPVLVPLRGDFFCAPFGANAETYKGEKHRVHGEPAWAKWKFKSLEKTDGLTTLTLNMKTKVRKGTVTKKLFLADGQNIVYLQHILDGYTGAMPMGHHATLNVGEAEKGFLVSTSNYKIGMTCISPTANPAEGCYQSLATGKKFTDLKKVPTNLKNEPYTDMTAYPARTGFGDIIAVFKKAGKTPAWTAAVNTKEKYLWFSLKCADVLPTTVFWVSNHDRHVAPWNGRNTCIGLEDVCGLFAEGLAPSVKKNIINKAGIATAVKLSAKKPTIVNYIQGAVKVPTNFGRVIDVEFENKKVVFKSETNKTVSAKVNWEFIKS